MLYVDAVSNESVEREFELEFKPVALVFCEVVKFDEFEDWNDPVLSVQLNEGRRLCCSLSSRLVIVLSEISEGNDDCLRVLAGEAIRTLRKLCRTEAMRERGGSMMVSFMFAVSSCYQNA